MSPPLRLYNTLTRTKETFAPIDPSHVRMYVCGPTVYDQAHIGNARPVIVFDVLYRLLRHLYGAEHVTYARNLTDVDDKINARAARDYPGLPLNEAIARVTEATTAQFHKDVAALGNLPPDHEPRATGHIAEMKAIIERLIARGVAYVAEEHVLFHVPAVAHLSEAPRYGALARRPLDEMIAGARVDVAPYKRDPMDFVLWKPSRDGVDPSWPSPAGIATPGRPGWHIECSAMAMATLLSPFGGGLACDDPGRNIFDIHGGGIDLVFPHHENEIAQSCCAFGGVAGAPRMANIWMHNGFLQVEGEKMSKSLGNFVTIHELLETERFGGRRWPGAVLRLAMLKTHYRQPIDWTVKALEEAEVNLREWSDAALSLYADEVAETPSPELINSLSDDLSLSDFFVVASSRAKSGDRIELGFLLHDLIVLGLVPDIRSAMFNVAWGLKRDIELGKERLKYRSLKSGPVPNGMLEEIFNKIDLNDQIEKRNAAKRGRLYEVADNIRNDLASKFGIILLDESDGTRWKISRDWVDIWMAERNAKYIYKSED